MSQHFQAIYQPRSSSIEIGVGVNGKDAASLDRPQRGKRRSFAKAGSFGQRAIEVETAGHQDHHIGIRRSQVVEHVVAAGLAGGGADTTASGSLDQFEVMDEDTKSELLLARGTELADMKVREVQCDGEVTARAASCARD